MNPFKKKGSLKSAEKINPTQTLQQVQQEFNQGLFELGNLNYRKHMVHQELSRLSDDMAKLSQKLDAMGVEAAKLRQKIQEEVAKTAASGTPAKDASNEKPVA
jgi:predicted  nucleic acid-binding Zn-ribbon protein